MSLAIHRIGCCGMKPPGFLLVAVLPLIFSHALLADYIAPEKLPGIIPISSEQLINLSQRTKVVIVDSRLAVDRKQGHIETSVGLPDTATDCDSLAALAPRTATPLLFYCNGPKCPRSSRAATIAHTCGYAKVFWLRGGFEEWKQKKYPYLKQ